ncbi:MAG: twin-arginine translocase TatA/TatE family subunit [Acidimicrobiia bacterium]
MGSVGMPELLIILIILLLLFGANKLPQLARSIGLAKKEFDQAVAEGSKQSSQNPSTETSNTKPAADPEKDTDHK